MDKGICCICGKTGIKKKTNMIHTIYQCSSCGLMWLEINGQHNTEKAQYVKSFENFNDLRIENFNSILNVMHELLPNGAKGLEVGSACGTFLVEAKKRGYIVSGIEPMKDSFQIAKDFGLDVYNGFFPQDLPSGEKYEFIVFNDVFEHIPNIRNVVDACYQLLNPGGILVINLPVTAGVLFRIANILDKFNRKDYLERMWQIKTQSPHLYYFNDKNLVNLLINNGFNYYKRINMKTFKIRGLNERISAVFFSKMRAQIIAMLLIISIPILNILPKDTKCFVFKKI